MTRNTIALGYVWNVASRIAANPLVGRVVTRSIALGDCAWALTAAAVRAAAAHSPAVALLQATPQAQPLLLRMQRAQIYMRYREARRRVPAYRALLNQHTAPPLRNGHERLLLPPTDKENYVRAYPLEARCLDGRLPPAAVIDESSGSSGAPTNWVRGSAERAQTTRSMQRHFAMVFDDGPYVLLNCFALGPWATGMLVASALAACGQMKAVGPDADKLENTLRTLGPAHKYILFGYPPFIKGFLDTTSLDLRAYQIAAVVGGEGISEALRARLETTCWRVISTYGASDLEINIGVESDLTRALRARCACDSALCLALFGAASPPMLFQYNPMEYWIETNQHAELLFSICRAGLAAPKLRYNLHDHGGVLSQAELARRLQPFGIALADLAPRRAAFPLVYVFGRSDMSVPFYGAKISPGHVAEVLARDPLLAQHVHSFQLRASEQADLTPLLEIRLELERDRTLPLADDDLCTRVFGSLAAVNQDFRAVGKLCRPDQLAVRVFPRGTGPFANQDARIKQQYIAA